MFYNLANELDKQSFKTKVNHLYKKGCMVELTEKSKRTIQQNKYFYLILGWFAREYGSDIEFIKNNYFKRLVNKDLFVIEYEDKFLGKVEKLRSSRDVTKEEMTKAIEKFRNWSASEAGIYLPSADETDFLETIEYEVHKAEKWL